MQISIGQMSFCSSVIVQAQRHTNTHTHTHTHTLYLVGLQAPASQNPVTVYCVRGSPRSCVISSHLSRGPVRQPPYVHPARSGPRSSLFLPSSAVTVCDAVADNWFGQDSGARTDSQSSRLLQQLYQTRMWANAQRDGRPAEHRWRPLFNAAKFGWRPLLDVVQ